MKVFLDTNIVIDVVVRREPQSNSSSALLTLAEKGVIDGIVSAITFNNLYYIARKEIGNAKAMQAISILRDICKVVALDGKIIGKAIDSGIADFEDAIQFFSALQAQADYLVTRNPKHFPDDYMPVMTPEAFLTIGVGEE
jgi:predicted nucleic acid-binding protein